ncbi:MAG: gfo/Idh/MocA family oxidoreductase, partial [Candidatus Omnitrophica bacterium]|nr:gfo/Idh/MocA family oxidoreductase [Candidatus Omnitrophota bacterium]
HDNGVIFYGDGGIVEFGRKGCIVTRIGKEPEPLGGGSDFTENIRNFLACARDNNPSGLNAPISEGALSTILSHLGNIGVRVGRRLRLDPETCRILDDPEADAMLGRTYREGYELPVV